VDVLLVVDMQEGLLRGAPKHDLLAVVERINRLALRVRRSGGAVFFVQHAGPVGDDFEPRTPGWHLLATIKTEPGDRIVSKTLNDAFFKTSLQSDLAELRADRLLVAGWATDLCVDATIRSAAAARGGSRSRLPEANRRSIRRFWPSTYPRALRRFGSNTTVEPRSDAAGGAAAAKTLGLTIPRRRW